MAKNYYKILGINKSASDEAIKKSYRKLALKFHPDKNKSPLAVGRFKEIAEAYEVLGDKQKRKIYDRNGEYVLRAERSSSESEQEDNNTSFTFEFHGDPYATFAEFFGSENPFGLFFGSCDFPMTIFDEDGIFVNMENSSPGSGMRQIQTEPIVQDLEVSLEELYRGCTKNVEISRMLPDDNGVLRKEQKLVPINVMPGWKPGTKITFEKAVDRTPGKTPADFIIVIRDKPHPQFKREDTDLIYTAKLSLKQALCGTVIQVPTLKGEAITLNTKNEVIQPNTIKRIPGNGLPNPKQSSKFGDLLVVFEIKFPELPMKTKEKLFRLLPN